MSENLGLFTYLPEVRPSARVEKQQTRGSFLTGDNEWYTPSVYIEAARATMGEIDLDPASNEYAQGTVQAGKFYSEADNGLTQKWHGRVWLNPPYGRGVMSKFVFRLVHEFERGRVTQACLVAHNYTDTLWTHSVANVCSVMCLTRGRIKFYNSSGVGEAPPHGQIFYYLGKNVDAFNENFKQFGFIVVPYK